MTQQSKIAGVVLDHLVIDGDSVAVLQGVIDAAADDLADAVAELRARGMSWPALASALNVTPQAMAERYGCSPRRLESVRLRRRLTAIYGCLPEHGRLTVDGRLIYHSWQKGAWNLVRRCEDAGAALRLAEWLATNRLRFIATAGDFDYGVA